MLVIRSVDRSRLVETRCDSLPDPASAPKGVWYDLVDPTPEERAYVDRALRVSIPSRADMEEIEVSSRLYTEDGVEYMTVTAAAKLDSDMPVKSPVLFVVAGDALATVRYVELKPFVNVIERCGRPSGCASATGEQMMLTLVEAMVDRLADALEIVGERIDRASHDVFRPRGREKVSKRDHDLQAMIERIGQSGDTLGVIRESLVGFNRLVTYHHGLNTSGRAEADSRMRVIQRDVSALSDHASYLGSKIGFLLDATLGLINLEQNQIIKIFSIAAVCLMPPTLVASVYGMNFQHIPELAYPYGYPMALAMMIATAIAPYIYFKRRGWL